MKSFKLYYIFQDIHDDLDKFVSFKWDSFIMLHDIHQFYEIIEWN